jgi:hypothetical protein
MAHKTRCSLRIENREYLSLFPVRLSPFVQYDTPYFPSVSVSYYLSSSCCGVSGFILYFSFDTISVNLRPYHNVGIALYDWMILVSYTQPYDLHFKGVRTCIFVIDLRELSGPSLHKFLSRAACQYLGVTQRLRTSELIADLAAPGRCICDCESGALV